MKYVTKKYEYQHTYYLRDLIQTVRLKTTVKKVKTALKGKKFDAIAFSGMSGALIGPPVALAMNKPLIMVRKAGIKCHSGHVVEGIKNAKSYIILDDCVSSGDTARYIQKKIKKFSPNAKCLGVLETNNLPKKALNTSF